MSDIALPYNRLAQDYDCIIGSRESESKILARLLRRYCNLGARVLEIGCGTGELLLPFAARYQVEGLDISKRMIDCARRKLKTVPLHVADMRTFRLGRQFQFICCLFDTMNHLPTLGDWRKCLTAAHSHLLPGGVFVFDINTPHKLTALVSKAPFGFWLNKRKAIMLKVSAQGARMFNWEIDIFTRDNASKKYSLNSVVIREYVPDVADVTRLARQVFRSVKVVDASNRKATRTSERLYFVCEP